MCFRKIKKNKKQEGNFIAIKKKKKFSESILVGSMCISWRIAMRKTFFLRKQFNLSPDFSEMLNKSAITALEMNGLDRTGWEMARGLAH